MLDKNQRTTLEEGLSLRNKCGHPAKYNPGVVRAASSIEDVIGIIFKYRGRRAGSPNSELRTLAAPYHLGRFVKGSSIGVR